MLKFLWILIVAVLASSMLRTLWLSYQAQAEMKKRETVVKQAEAEVIELEDEVRTATASFTLEKRVREELELHRDGEAIIRVEP